MPPGRNSQSRTSPTRRPSGWQQVNFSPTVHIKAGTTYVAAYLAPNGHYSDTANAFAFSGVSNGPLSALANPVSANGLYDNSSTSVFPTNNAAATNFWVDVDFEPTTPPGQVTGVSATAGAGSATLTWSAPSSGGAVTGYTITPYIGSEAQTPVTKVTGWPPATSTTVTGLTNGTSYTFTVTATNGGGSGPASEHSNAVTPMSTPASPTQVTATAAGSGKATVAWTAPANGGSPITRYTVTPYIGTEAQATTTVTGTPPATGATVTGLTNGTSYTFTVTATNAVGTGPASEHSNAVTPTSLTPPEAPSEVAASAGNESATVTWTAPANGGSPITRYTVTPYIGTEAQATTTVTGTPPATGATVTGLTNGTSYTFTVTATNANGTGPASEPSSAVTPATTPSAPSVVTATAGNGSAAVTWTAPANGGSPITRYTVTPYIGTEAQATTTVTGTPPATGATVTGLTNGTSYTFTVTATNANGTGPASEHSSAVTPATTPSAPSVVTATAGNTKATVAWTAPANGGSPITSYTITPYIGATAQATTTITGSPPATSATITGLTNGTSYTFTVKASNSVGAGPASERSNAVTPSTITPPSAPTAVTASAATAQALLSWTAPSNNGGSSITSYTVTPYIGASAQTPLETGASATSTIVKGLTNGSAYTFTVAATNAAGTGVPSSASGAVTPQDTIFDFATPATINSNDTHSVDVGVKFTSEVPGTVTGIRFYKATANTGTHVASLWSAGGTLLAEATFAGESASGWQQVNFTAPVAIAANTTYVASYLAPKGDYSDNSSQFTTNPFSNPPLSALASPVSANGVYIYSAAKAFPTTSFKATNYWVDVDFEPSH